MESTGSTMQHKSSLQVQQRIISVVIDFWWDKRD